MNNICSYRVKLARIPAGPLQEMVILTVIFFFNVARVRATMLNSFQSWSTIQSNLLLPCALLDFVISLLCLCRCIFLQASTATIIYIVHKIRRILASAVLDHFLSRSLQQYQYRFVVIHKSANKLFSPFDFTLRVNYSSISRDSTLTLIFQIGVS